MNIKIARVTFFSIIVFLIVYAVWKSVVFEQQVGDLSLILRAMSIVLVVSIYFIVFFKYQMLSLSPVSIILYCYLVYIFLSYLIFEGNNIMEFASALFILLTYLITREYSKYLNIDSLKKLLYLMIFILLIIFSVSFVVNKGSLLFTGQLERSVRYTFGFVKPSYIAEYLLLEVYILVMLLSAHAIKNYIFYSLLLLNTILLFLTGARAALVAYAVFFGYLIVLKYKINKILFPFLVLFTVYFFFSSPMDILKNEQLNEFSSGRIFLWTAEIKHNIINMQQVFFGNPSPEAGFQYWREKTGDVFHIDSFYIEIFIKHGLVGLLLIISYLFALYQETTNNLGKALLMSITLYGIFESSILSLASLYGFLSLLLVFIGRNLNKL